MRDESGAGEAAAGGPNTAGGPAAVRDEPLENKRLLAAIFESWSHGDIRPFIEAMDDDFQWIFPGSWSWSGTWGPKKVVVQNLLREALGSQLAGPVRQERDFVLADEDRVIVQSRGFGTTKSGEAYRNTYCFVFRVRNGRLTEVIEHCDTSLVDRVLTPPS
jgi:ketosteroid isomerase-like protein